MNTIALAFQGRAPTPERPDSNEIRSRSQRVASSVSINFAKPCVEFESTPLVDRDPQKLRVKNNRDELVAARCMLRRAADMRRERGHVTCVYWVSRDSNFARILTVCVDTGKNTTKMLMYNENIYEWFVNSLYGAIERESICVQF